MSAATWERVISITAFVQVISTCSLRRRRQHSRMDTSSR
jgi:hypothetical protein